MYRLKLLERSFKKGLAYCFENPDSKEKKLVCYQRSLKEKKGPHNPLFIEKKQSHPISFTEASAASSYGDCWQTSG
jgi:hypothetical protein